LADLGQAGSGKGQWSMSREHVEETRGYLRMELRVFMVRALGVS